MWGDNFAFSWKHLSIDRQGKVLLVRFTFYVHKKKTCKRKNK